MEHQQRKLAILGVATALHPMDRGERDRGALRHLDGRLPAPTRNGERARMTCTFLDSKNFACYCFGSGGGGSVSFTF